MLDTLCVICLQLVTYWLTFSFMAIGFAVMFGGANGASAVAEFCFVRPVFAVGRASAWLCSAFAVAIGQTSIAVGKFLLVHLIDPLLLVIGRGLRRLLFPRRR